MLSTTTGELDIACLQITSNKINTLILKTLIFFPFFLKKQY